MGSLVVWFTSHRYAPLELSLGLERADTSVSRPNLLVPCDWRPWLIIHNCQTTPEIPPTPTLPVPVHHLTESKTEVDPKVGSGKLKFKKVAPNPPSPSSSKYLLTKEAFPVHPYHGMRPRCYAFSHSLF